MDGWILYVGQGGGLRQREVRCTSESERSALCNAYESLTVSGARGWS